MERDLDRGSARLETSSTYFTEDYLKNYCNLFTSKLYLINIERDFFRTSNLRFYIEFTFEAVFKKQIKIAEKIGSDAYYLTISLTKYALWTHSRIWHGSCTCKIKQKRTLQRRSQRCLACVATSINCSVSEKT